ncbi:membrane-bound O-acyltransferase family MBOAT [Leptospira broomii serovar Hurstbridge str. 5399]|uniref:Membrane-bound O-acyltransferase family MBOAT n=1 Tax=Leptospira broomii serovar Hurstbridge str. 5399 TaxID=1049789 RepID=T0GGV7_9LEPT|nr:MBOAT family O-acyltransferase [Leptospira broomii]EQA44628.1 membrane-bound O-acyltransferase family MBOAT [Leptospira broomii serovar Hurstbridge str. 5399]
MLFPTLEFFLFFSFVFLVHWYILPFLFPNHHIRKFFVHVFLLITSYAFYMSWDWRFGGLILLSTVIDFVLADKIHESKDPAFRKSMITLSLVLNLVFILGFFKYYNFLCGSLNDLLLVLGFPGIFPILKIVLPVGVSFYTFQSLSYTIDVYRGTIPSEKSFLRFALFVSFFPQLVAGPIVTAKTFLPQLETEKKLESIQFRKAIRYFFLGYFKKVILSDNVSPIGDLIFKNPESYSTEALWLAAFLFWVQVYCDFSGYTDMAYSCALLLGYELPENFRMPYLSRSVTEHWRRWHITLSSWLRDYVYISMGGSRAGAFRHRFNIWFTMFVAGFWHGANWTFVLWGSIQGGFLLIESLLKDLKSRVFPNLSLHPAWDNAFIPIRIVYTSLVAITFGVIFRSETLSKAFTMISGMYSYRIGELRPYMFKFGIPAILCVIVGHYLGWLIFEKEKRIRIPVWLEFSLYPFGAVLFALLSPDAEVPFIYFQF